MQDAQLLANAQIRRILVHHIAQEVTVPVFLAHIKIVSVAVGLTLYPLTYIHFVLLLILACLIDSQCSSISNVGLASCSSYDCSCNYGSYVSGIGCGICFN
jgi:hypothetical protein